MPGRSKLKLKGRTDRARLNTHFDNIEEHFEQYQVALTRANFLAARNRKLGKKNLVKKWTNHARAAKGKLTEAIGEQNATNKILRDRPRWRLQAGFSPGTGFDQVWRKPASGKLNVVEAKGPGATLGISDRKGRQLSKSWVKATAEGLHQDFGIANALAPGQVGGVGGVPKVRGYVITSTPTGKTAEKNWEKLRYN